MEGERVAGRYLVEHLAGVGGMAKVWRATDLRDYTPVAIKRMHDGLRHDPEVLTMFADEVAITASIRHPNVVALLAHGHDLRGPWMALEWVEGVSGHELLARRRAPLGLRASLALALDVLQALAATHGPGVGVIHRDVAPANVLVGIDGVTRLADYGLARSIARVRVNAPGTAKGKIGYLPPEVLRGAIHGTRGDIYGVGAVLWELLAGRRLFAGVTQKSALARAYLHAQRPSLASVRPDLPASITTVIDSALSLDPSRRPPNAMAMAERLLTAAAREGVTASMSELSMAVWGARKAMAGGAHAGEKHGLSGHRGERSLRAPVHGSLAAWQG
jgi:serine/threonine-protein kinase